MSARISRRKLAIYVAEQLAAGSSGAIDELAALLATERRVDEVDLIVRDIETELANRGVLVVTVETAEGLDIKSKQAIVDFLGGEVVLREVVKPELIGGVRIETPTMELDETIAKKLQTLKALSAKDMRGMAK